MPIYEYKCETCEKCFDVLAGFNDPPPSECEHCGAKELRKVLHPAAVHYKGSGFYSTDYANKGGKKESSTGSSSDSSSSGESSGGNSDSGSSSSDSGSSSADSGSSSSGSGKLSSDASSTSTSGKSDS